MQRNFGALFGPAPAVLARTSRLFLPSKEISRADLPLARLTERLEKEIRAGSIEDYG
jgi:hypothetical protein